MQWELKLNCPRSGHSHVEPTQIYYDDLLCLKRNDKFIYTGLDIIDFVYFYRPYDVALLDTFATASLNELDYIKEASNQERFV